MMKDTQKLTDQEWNDLVRSFLRKLVKNYTKNWGDASRAAESLNKKPTSIGDMKRDANGTVVTWVRFIAFALNWSDSEVKKNLKDPQSLIDKIKKVGPPDMIDELLVEVLKIYSKNEVIAWLKLLLAKAQVEESLDLKPSLKNTKKKK